MFCDFFNSYIFVFSPLSLLPEKGIITHYINILKFNPLWRVYCMHLRINLTPYMLPIR